MKKTIFSTLCVLLTIGLTGCDNTNDKSKIINVVCETQYVNTTETWSINSHNGYKAIYTNKAYDEETDIYTVTIKFGRLLD